MTCEQHGKYKYYKTTLQLYTTAKHVPLVYDLANYILFTCSTIRPTICFGVSSRSYNYHAITRPRPYLCKLKYYYYNTPVLY